MQGAGLFPAQVCVHHHCLYLEHIGCYIDQEWNMGEPGRTVNKNCKTHVGA